MAFRGWPAEAVEFYEGLEADNSKAYWQDQKAVYEQAVRAPMEALLQQLEPEFGPGKIFRPYRDVRFSADKTPYKTAMGAVASRGDAIHYVQLSAAGLFVGTGYYQLARDQLTRFRAAVDAGTTGEELATTVARLEKAGYDVGGEALRTAPRGFPADHPRIRLLRHKGMYAGRALAVAPWLGTAKAADRVVRVWRDATPLNDWLAAHVGPSTEPERTR